MRVFKYRGGDKRVLKRDIRSLINNEVYCASFETLNDIFEAKCIVDEQRFILSRMSDSIKSSDLKKINNSTLKIINEYIEVSNGFGVYSLSKSFKDELLWAYYANSHQGFCIEYDLDELVEYRMRDELIIDVNYQKNMPFITDIDLINFHENRTPDSTLNKKLIATKSERWRHEDEVRIVTGRSGLYKYNYSSLKGIYFGCRCDSILIKLVMKVLRGRGIKYYQMKPKKDSYNLERIRIEDKYAGFDYPGIELAIVEEGAVNISDNNRQYSDYLLKAMELVRRYPDSKKIFNVDISLHKGSESNPMIYVQYISN
ncbi:DUF2971 domain-containing protein, partial [Serratia marcescens]